MTDTPHTTIPTCILTPHGVQPTPYTASSLADAAAKEPGGVYTLGRTYRRDHILLFDDHLNRLEQSARLIGLNVTLDRPALRRALRDLIDQSGYAESRYRITLPQDAPENVILSLETFKPVPPEIIEQGARCATIQMARHNPAAKTTAWMLERKPAVENLPPGTYEGILLGEDDALLEGMSSNFYAVMDGKLYTAGEGVLGGMAQRIVLSLAPALLPVDLTPVKLRDLPFLDEAFISSAGRGVVPVIMINQQIIGEGKPGSMTVTLRDRYNVWADAHLESL